MKKLFLNNNPMKKIFYPFFLLLLHNGAQAQNKPLQATFNHPSNKGLVYVLSKTHIFNRNDFKDICLSSFGFIKFTVNRNGKVDSIAFTNSIPASLKPKLRKAVKDTENYWLIKNTDSLTSNSRLFLIPVDIFVEAGCDKPGNPKVEQTPGNIFNFDDHSLVKNWDCSILYESLILHRSKGRVDFKKN